MKIFESRRQRLLPAREFLLRVGRSFLLASSILVFALAVGIIGYRSFSVDCSWLDSLLNASMLLGGMGPVNCMDSTAGKLFASFYALFSGLAFITMAGIIVSPVAHRLLHWFHIEDEQSGRADDANPPRTP